MRPRHAHIRRYREIVRALARHGLGVAMTELAPRRAFTLVPRWLGVEAAPTPAHIRMALEELGTTFIKVGQILSTRADLLPLAYAREFERLRDRVPPVDARAVRAVIEEDLGRPVGETFLHFEDRPLASASIGQVHRAILADGSSVVVKVQKPGVAERVDVDLAILHHLARAALSRRLLGGMVDPVALVDEFAHTLRAELDYRQEARNAQAMARNFAGNPHLRVPRVRQEFTTRRVLVMEELTGIHIDDHAALRQAGIDLTALAHRSAHILLQSIFEHGLYHADPHPGNFLVQTDGSLAALDFGMVGRLDAPSRDAMLRLVLAGVRREPAAVLDGLEGLGVRFHGSERPLLREFAHLMDAYADLALGEIELAPLIGDVYGVAARFQLQLPADLALLLKTLAMNEGVGRQLDPKFVATEELAHYLRDLALRRAASPNWALQGLQRLADAAAIGVRLPRRLEHALLALEQGEVNLDGTPAFWARARREAGVASGRIALAVLSAGMLLAAALLLSGATPAEGWLRGSALIFGAGGTVLGLAVLINSLRQGR